MHAMLGNILMCSSENKSCYRLLLPGTINSSIKVVLEVILTHANKQAYEVYYTHLQGGY